MHGVLIRDRKQISDAEIAADCAAAEGAMKLLYEIINAKKLKSYTPEYFQKSLDLLKLNPELILGWNIRREILISMLNHGGRPQNDSLLVDELSLLNSVMVELQMTKSYCLWNHRRWVIEKLRAKLSQQDMSKIITDELKIIERIHSMDSRNFHAWSYRKFLVDTFSLKLDDLEYSKKLIESDFSNYSAWYLRMAAFDTASIDPQQEHELVWNAIFTEPNDQSAWQYHDWLLERFPNIVGEEDMIKELESVIDEKDSKYLLLQRLRRNPGNVEIRQRLATIDPMRKGYYLDNTHSI
jgi:geranylgeranyl transferase type-2 subunit alpha